MSMTFPTSSGSVENRNDSARHGLTPYARHARATCVLLIFSWPASSRLDQCVTPYFFGGGFNVSATIAAVVQRHGAARARLVVQARDPLA